MQKLKLSMTTRVLLWSRQSREMLFRSSEYRTFLQLEISYMRFQMRIRLSLLLLKENRWLCRTSISSNKRIQSKLLKLDWIIEQESLCMVLLAMMLGFLNSNKNRMKLMKRYKSLENWLPKIQNLRSYWWPKKSSLQITNNTSINFWLILVSIKAISMWF
jgi:hypothetical protein